MSPTLIQDTFTMATFWKTKGQGLKKAIEQAAVSRSKIASDGGLSAETLKRAVDGHRIIDTKANAIVKGLKTHGVQVVKDELFVPA